jgi:hypothetical protein
MICGGIGVGEAEALMARRFRIHWTNLVMSRMLMNVVKLDKMAAI